MLQSLVRTDRSTELLTGLQVLGGHRQRGFECTDGLSHDRSVAQVEDLGQDGVGISSVEALCGDTVELEVRAAQSIGLTLSHTAQALGIGGDEVESQFAVLRGGDDEVVGDVSAEHVVLLTGEGEAAVGTGDLSLRGVDGVAQSGLERCESEEGLALCHTRQDGLLLLFAAAEQDGIGAEDCGRQERFEDERAPERLGDHGHLVEGHVRAAVGLGDCETEQSHLGERLPLLAGDALFAAKDLFALGDVVLGAQVLVQCAGEFLLNVVEFKIHGCPSWEIE